MPLLEKLGWEPTAEWDFITGLARHLAAHPRPTDAVMRERERQVLAESDTSDALIRVAEAPRRPASQQQNWAFGGWVGEPASLAARPLDHVPSLPAPVLKTRRLAIGAMESFLMRGELKQRK